MRRYFNTPPYLYPPVSHSALSTTSLIGLCRSLKFCGTTPEVWMKRWCICFQKLDLKDTSLTKVFHHLSLSQPIPSHPIPSHPIPSHPIPSHPIPSDLVPVVSLWRLMVVLACFWYDTNNRVDFFKNFAKRHGFDPLLATNWYDVTKSHIVSQKVLH